MPLNVTQEHELKSLSSKLVLRFPNGIAGVIGNVAVLIEEIVLPITIQERNGKLVDYANRKDNIGAWKLGKGADVRGTVVASPYSSVVVGTQLSSRFEVGMIVDPVVATEVFDLYRAEADRVRSAFQATMGSW